MVSTYNPVYKILPGGAGGFMDPPGHPHHTHHLEGFETPRKRNAFYHGSLSGALADDFDGSDYVKDRVRRMMDGATLVESEAWVRSVYGYFRSMYLPESGSANASDLISHSPSNIAVAVTRKVLDEVFGNTDLTDRQDPHNYRTGVYGFGKRRGFEITAKGDGSRVYVYALADDGTRYSANHLGEYADALFADFENVEVKPHPVTLVDRVEADMRIVPEPMDPERHAAVACVRRYFPDHEIRHDLILDAGKGYGSYPCTKCGEKVQYEAKFDKLTKITTRVGGTGMTHWTYGTECTDGGEHTTD